MKASRFALVLVISAALFAGCGATSGNFKVAVTDAPVDAANIEAVNVTFTGFAVNTDASGWTEESDSGTINLLDLSNGASTVLGGLWLPGGTTVNQIRLDVSKVEITFNDGTPAATATLPSTALKVVNSFDVPSNGEITVMVDFDLRKCIVYNNQGWKLKPALRAVVEGEAGSISGTIPAGSVVYAYDDGAWDPSESTPNATDGSTYANAVTSAKAGEDGTYKLAYLAPVTYDLVVVTGDVVDATTYADKVVAAGDVTTVNIQ